MRISSHSFSYTTWTLTTTPTYNTPWNLHTLYDVQVNQKQVYQDTTDIKLLLRHLHAFLYHCHIHLAIMNLHQAVLAITTFHSIAAFGNVNSLTTPLPIHENVVDRWTATHNSPCYHLQVETILLPIQTTGLFKPFARLNLFPIENGLSSRKRLGVNGKENL